MSELRFRVVEKAFHKKPIEVTPPSERPSEYFAKYVFNREKMFKYLPSKVYAKLIDPVYAINTVGIHNVSSTTKTGEDGSHAL